VRVAGLDLSLTSTGYASANLALSPALAVAERLRPGKLRGHERLRWIYREAGRRCGGADLVVVEGPSYGSHQGQHQLGGLFYLVTHVLWQGGITVVVVPPPSLKKYATGNGGASKDEVLAAVVRRYPAVDVRGNDEADALVLAAMGADFLGHPLVPVPAVHRQALAKWPYEEK
jgi:hypothetical protein